MGQKLHDMPCTDGTELAYVINKDRKERSYCIVMPKAMAHDGKKKKNIEENIIKFARLDLHECDNMRQHTHTYKRARAV